MAGYDDMGLEFGGLSQLLDAQMMKDAVVASVAGGSAVLLGAYGMNKLLALDFMPQFVKDNRKVFKGLGLIAMGYAGGALLYEHSREASLGVLGGLGAIGVANIVNHLILGAKAVSLEGDDDMLSSGDQGLLSNYDNMSALAALEATSVESAQSPFQGLADPTVTNEALMGFQGAVTQTEQYAPYLS